MNKLPTKQIYLLVVIIVGIIALSVYSTYALFTFESSTSDIVSIHTPKSLQISENIYEYQQLTVEPNTIATTDIDIYNTFDYEVCYSIWYKIVGYEALEAKIQVFEKSDETLTSSGVLSSLETIRVTIVIINDNDSQVKINLGTIGSQKEEASCSLNLTNDKKVISSSYKNVDKLTTKILKDNQIPSQLEASFLTYKDQTDTITFEETDKLYVSNNFNYVDEVFTLSTEEELTFKEVVEKKYLDNSDLYFCQGNGKNCNILYKITDYEIEELENQNPEEKRIVYHINKYDKLIGYSKGENGLRKINETDFVFYGDNPNNFVYYNCQNNDDLTTCELWRIVGLFYNNETNEYNTKLIRNDSVGKHQFDINGTYGENQTSNIWMTSTLYKYLNEEYKLINNYDSYLYQFKQKTATILSLEEEVKNIKSNEPLIDSKITLLNLSDYLYTSSCVKDKVNEYTGECLKNNWLNNIEISHEWTMTPKELIEEETENKTEDTTESETVKEKTIKYIYAIGQTIEEYAANETLDIRPAIFLKERMLLLDGAGTLENPYIIK